MPLNIYKSKRIIFKPRCELKGNYVYGGFGLGDKCKFYVEGTGKCRISEAICVFPVESGREYLCDTYKFDYPKIEIKLRK